MTFTAIAANLGMRGDTAQDISGMVIERARRKHGVAAHHFGNNNDNQRNKSADNSKRG